MNRRSPASRGNPCETGAVDCALTRVGTNTLPPKVDANIPTSAAVADRFLPRTPRHVNSFFTLMMSSCRCHQASRHVSNSARALPFVELLTCTDRYRTPGNSNRPQNITALRPTPCRVPVDTPPARPLASRRRLIGVPSEQTDPFRTVNDGTMAREAERGGRNRVLRERWTE